MNIAEIISLARSEILDDTISPRLWTDTGLVSYFNRAYDELVRETYCIVDSSTVSVCQVPLLANQSLHATSPKVLKILNSWLNSNGYPLDRKTEAFMNGYFNWRATTGTYPYWLVMDSQNRYIVPYPKYDTTGYVAGASNITFDAGAKTITKIGETFTSHYATGDSIVVTGSLSNNGTLTLSNVTDTILTVNETPVNENLCSATLRKVRDTVLMRVARLPLVTYTANDLELATPPTPELDATYHYGLMDGIAKYAYLKQDTETYDPQKSKRHGDMFEEFKSKVLLEVSILTEGGNSQCYPHVGTL